MDDALGTALQWEPAATTGARCAAALLPVTRARIQVGRVTLMPHQQDAEWLVSQAIARWGGALLADPVGTGKTWVALAVARVYSDVMVVAPAALRRRWADAFEMAERPGKFRSFESLSRNPRADDTRASFLIVDEAHHARNPATRRFDALARLAWGRPLLLLSATPVHNRARDLHTLCSLFLGEAASRLPPATLERLVCRRLDVGPAGLPEVAVPHWLALDDDDVMFALLRDLPPPLPPSDGGTAAALGALTLLRQWASSEAALLAALERRLTIGIAMESRLAQGGTLTRTELHRWIVETGTVQLGLPLPDASLAEDLSIGIAHVRRHLDGLRAAREHLQRRGTLDRLRLAHVRAILDAALPSRVACFTHSVDTARAMYRALAPSYRVALLAGPETRIASGSVSRDIVVQQFAPGTSQTPSAAMRVDVLLATDVMSEGVDLHDACTLVHLDLPWTMARLQQRVGRLRRLGASHQRIRQFAFEPCGGAARWMRLLDRLARKAGVAARLVGDHPLTLALPDRRRPHHQSTADDASRVASILRTWLEPGACPPPPASHTVAAVAMTHESTAVACLALVDIGDGPRLVLRSASEISVSPGRIARTIAAAAIDAPCPAPTARQRRLLQLNVRVITTWCAVQADQVELLGARQGETHRRVLRRLAALRDGKPRSVQRALAQRLARTTDVVLRSQGAGVERWLEEWLRRHPAPTVDENLLDELHEALAPRARQPAPQSWQGVIAAILLVPMRR